MPRPKGSKVFSCPKCGGRVIAFPSKSGVCKSCNTKTRFTKAVMAAQAPIARKPPQDKVAATPEPKKRGRKPTVKPAVKPTVETPVKKKRGRPPTVKKAEETIETPKRGRRGKSPVAKKVVEVPTPKKRGPKPTAKKETPIPTKIAPRILPPPKKTSK